jgi:hypothetical protein
VYRKKIIVPQWNRFNEQNKIKPDILAHRTLTEYTYSAPFIFINELFKENAFAFLPGGCAISYLVRRSKTIIDTRGSSRIPVSRSTKQYNAPRSPVPHRMVLNFGFSGGGRALPLSQN